MLLTMVEFYSKLHNLLANFLHAAYRDRERTIDFTLTIETSFIKN